MRKPANRTHKDDERIEISNLVVVLISIGSIPIFLYMIFGNLLLVVAIEFLFLVGFMDMILTADMLNRGYREANFYRFFFSHLGNRVGFAVSLILNISIRGIFCLVYWDDPDLILVFALASFFGPLWNTLHSFSFRDDIVLRMPTEISANEEQIEVDSGRKVRLEQQKDGDDQE